VQTSLLEFQGIEVPLARSKPSLDHLEPVLGQVKQKKKIARPSPKVKVSCLSCGKEFFVPPSKIKRGWGKYCSKPCFYVARYSLPEGARPIHTCLVCGKKFFTKQAIIKKGHGKYCSHACKGVAWAKKLEAARPIGICQVCGKEFIERPYWIKKGKGKYCSRKCKGITFKTSKPIVCERCGKTVIKKPNQIARHKHSYCSVKCANADLIGPKASNWLGGISYEPYCYKFNERLKEEVRAKFGYKCFLCGKAQEKRRLTVHHCDYNKVQGCKGMKWSLLPMHHKCHLKTNCNRWYWFGLLRDWWVYDCPGTELKELVPDMFVNAPPAKRKSRKPNPSLA